METVNAGATSPDVLRLIKHHLILTSWLGLCALAVAVSVIVQVIH